MEKSCTIVAFVQRPSVFEQLPEDLRGLANDPAHLFACVQRSYEWRANRPALGKKALFELAERFDCSLPIVERIGVSEDGARKVVLRLSDGALIEAVHMPRATRSPRATLCVSTQVGCAIGCGFCHTARMGLVRNLRAHEIVAQVLLMLNAFGPAGHGHTSIVFMGMGEPLANLHAVLRAVRVLCDHRGLGVPPGRMTLSTVGLVPKLLELAQAPVRPLLALSLHAPTDELRAKLLPVAHLYPLRDVRAALHRYPFRNGETLTLEYVLIRDVNDDPALADGVVDFARGLPHKVNLIPFNAWPGAPFERPSERRIEAFFERLVARGSFVTVRRSRGASVQAACGQLVSLSTRAKAPSLQAPQR